MPEEKELERQYRKNLMIMASVMLVYSIAGGEIVGDISMFGVAIKFNQSGYLDWLGLIVMYFLWWRHWLSSSFIRQSMKELVIQEGVLSARSVKKILECMLPGHEVTIKPPGVSLAPNNKHQLVVGVGGGRSTLAELRMHTIYPMQVHFGSTIIDLINGLQSEFEYTRDSVYKVSSKLVKLHVAFDYWRWFVICAIKYPSFGDGLLPTIIVGLSSILFIVNKI
ncbi:TPA: hypothetical protein ACNUUK_001948 [Aeromonas salmonicida subsp. smithia]